MIPFVRRKTGVVHLTISISDPRDDGFVAARASLLRALRSAGRMVASLDWAVGRGALLSSEDVQILLTCQVMSR